MRIHKLKIKRFRNLRNFEINFTEDITMLLGKNGSAKSNLIEAIATIFSEIERGAAPTFAYYLRYECNSRIVEINAGFSNENNFCVKADEEEIDYDSFVNEEAPTAFSEDETIASEDEPAKDSAPQHRKYASFFPSNVFIYYSGLSDRLTKVCATVKEKYTGELMGGNDPRLRRVFLTDGSHSSLILLAFFAEGSEWAKKFLRERLGISELLSARLSLTRPEHLDKEEYGYPSSDSPHDQYWPARGRILEMLKKLQHYSLPLRDYGMLCWALFIAVSLAFILFQSQFSKAGIITGLIVVAMVGMELPGAPLPSLGLRKLHFFFNSICKPEELCGRLLTEDGFSFLMEDGNAILAESSLRPKDLFQRLDDLRLAGYKLDVHFRLKLERANEPVSLTHLSEGEQQLLTVIGLLRFTKDNDTLFLLDEPDTHLNPQWSYEYKKMLEEVMEGASGSQIIMATHDPVLIAGLSKDNVRLMERKDQAEAPDEAEWVIEARLPDEDPRGMGVARILESELFEVSVLDAETLRDLTRKRELAFKETLDPNEEAELRRLVRDLRNIVLTQVIEDPLYTHFVRAVVKHPEYPRLKDVVWNEETSAVVKRISEEVRDELLHAAEGEQQ